ncbi:hypothetical protein AALO_G00145780 [Alosa alosa]|uniref:Adiponectin receptor protein 1 n=1 Tax=Alosa alosa TaxID=278164 RepID=A0AAV6GNV5_9TELE|nr:hypothetical protein AALO_G00145780 [Alosa alosa]
MLRPNMYFMALQEKVVLNVGCKSVLLLLLALPHRLPLEKSPRATYSREQVIPIIITQYHHRPTRAGVFMGLGLSGIVPTMHFTIEEGFVKATTVGQMGWFYLMGAMYITGAGLYAARIPERYFPGKCDILFHSHQIFHVLVVAAAFIHFYGVSNLQEFRYGLEGGCTDDTLL